MKYKKAYIQKKIIESVRERPGERNILVFLPGSNPTHEYIISYDSISKQVTGVVEKISRYKKRPISINDIIQK